MIGKRRLGVTGSNVYGSPMKGARNTFPERMKFGSRPRIGSLRLYWPVWMSPCSNPGSHPFWFCFQHNLYMLQVGFFLEEIVI